MSVAALGAQTLSHALTQEGFTAPALSTKVQHALAAPVEGAWSMAVGQDIWYPATKGPTPTRADHAIAQYSRRLLKTATGSYTAAAALSSVTSMESTASALLRPNVLLAALNGPLLPRLSAPPLTPAEQKTLANLSRL